MLPDSESHCSRLDYYTKRMVSEEWISERTRVALVSNMEFGLQVLVDETDGEKAAETISQTISHKCGFMVADSTSAETTIELFTSISISLS